MKRSNSLDALRGFAILAMVLSSSIAFGILPDWMYHAQTPPPSHAFNPGLPGLTWVDLVFPFFLFSMGAAFPLALGKKLDSGEPAFKIFAHILQRYLLLVFFALFTLHARAWVQAQTPAWPQHLLSIGCFVLLCGMYIRFENRRLSIAIKTAAYALAVLFLVLSPFADGKGFRLDRSDVIIIVLANMAFFGSLTWWAFRQQPLLYVGVLPFIMAVFLAAKTAGSWNQALYNWSPLPWMYKFYYLKYLFIIVPGIFAGQWLRAVTATVIRNGGMVALICLALVLLNLYGLQSRLLAPNLLLSGALCAVLLWLMRNQPAGGLTRFAQAGAYLLLLGLFFEAYEGGIKKDPSTYSYYFVTAGLAFLVLLAFCIAEQAGYCKKLLHYLALNGKNPMVAYVTGNLLLIPLLHLSGLITWFNKLDAWAWTGFLKGLLFTGTVSLVTIFFVKRKWFWKT